jgi:hypothetical protein
MNIENILDGTHASITRRRWTQFFTAFVRVLLALAFIPPSIPKIMHKPFTILPESHPVGHYFNALYQTGYYYDFIGWTQITAATLLLIPRTSHIGALMFFPIIVNIAVLTNSVGFKGTWLITILMSVACLYLVAWEYDRWKGIIFHTRRGRTNPYKLQWLTVPLFFAVGGFAISALWRLMLIGNLADYLWAGFILAGIGLTFGILVTVHFRFMPVGEIKDS